MKSVDETNSNLRSWLEEKGSCLYNRVYLGSTPIWNSLQVKQGVLGRIGDLSVSVTIVTILRDSAHGRTRVVQTIYS